MRKTNIALLVAVVTVSPIVLADGYDSHSSSGDDVVIEGSGNYVSKSSYDLEVNKTATIKNVGNTDDDLVYLNDVGNDKSTVMKDNSDWSQSYTDNSTLDASQTWDVDIYIDDYLASSYLSGEVMDASVTYGGACCGDHEGGNGSTNVEVNQTNTMHDAFGSASGINIAGQNVGNNSLVQQTTNTNAILAGSSGSGGY